MTRIGPNDPTISTPGENETPSTSGTSGTDELTSSANPDVIDSAPARTSLPVLSSSAGANPLIEMERRPTLGASSASLALSSDGLARSGTARAAFMADAKSVHQTLPGYEALALNQETRLGSAAVVLVLYFAVALLVVVNITVSETETSGPDPKPDPGPTTLRGGGWTGGI